MNIDDRLIDLEILCEEEHSRIYREYECEQHCDCVLSKEEIERLVALCEEDDYIVPRGLTREERRKYMKDVGHRSSYGLTRERAERISKNTEESYKSRFSFSNEEARKLGDSMMEHYLNLTKIVAEGVKLD